MPTNTIEAIKAALKKAKRDGVYAEVLNEMYMTHGNPKVNRALDELNKGEH